jgi:hypothetical protein
VRILLNT